jgi:peroxiredoxin
METTATAGVGTTAPPFTLKGPGGQPVSLSDYRGKSVVLVFFPLAFSPVCSHQLPDIQKELGRVEARNGTVLGISVDSHFTNEAFAKHLGLTFPLLSDWRREVSRAYGVLLSEQGFSQRALFVIDEGGTIAYKDVSPTPPQVPEFEKVIETLARRD